MVRIKLKHGTARVKGPVSNELLAALNKLSEKAFNHLNNKPNEQAKGN